MELSLGRGEGKRTRRGCQEEGSAGVEAATYDHKLMCVCIYLSLSLSLSIYIYIYIYIGSGPSFQTRSESN